MFFHVEHLLGEYRVVAGAGEPVGPDTQHDDFNGRVLRLLREQAPERDSLGYVWPTRDVAACALARACRRRQ